MPTLCFMRGSLSLAIAAQWNDDHLLFFPFCFLPSLDYIRCISETWWCLRTKFFFLDSLRFLHVGCLSMWSPKKFFTCFGVSSGKLPRRTWIHYVCGPKSQNILSVGHEMPIYILPCQGPDWTSAGNPLVISHQDESGLSGGTSSVIISCAIVQFAGQESEHSDLNWGTGKVAFLKFELFCP